MLLFIDIYSFKVSFQYKQINTIKIAKKVSIFVWSFSATVNTLTTLYYFMPFVNETDRLLFLFQPVNRLTASFNQKVTAAILFSLLRSLTFLTLCSLYKRSSTLHKRTKKGVSLEIQMSSISIIMVVESISLFPTIYFNVSFFLNKAVPY